MVWHHVWGLLNISSKCQGMGRPFKLKLLMTSLEKLTSWPLKAGGEGDDRGWDGWMAWLTWWTCVWASFGSWWWTGKPGVLQSMGAAKSRTQLSVWTELSWISWPLCCCWVAKSCLSLCNAMDCSRPGFPLLHDLLQFPYWVRDAIQPPHLLSPPSFTFNLSQHQYLFMTFVHLQNRLVNHNGSLVFRK